MMRLLDWLERRRLRREFRAMMTAPKWTPERHAHLDALAEQMGYRQPRRRP